MNVAHSTPSAIIWSEQKRSYSGMWLALVLALLLHFIFVLIPIVSQDEPPLASSNNIELQVSHYTPEPVTPLPAIEIPQNPPQEQPMERPFEQNMETPGGAVQIPEDQPATETPSQLPLTPQDKMTDVAEPQTQTPLPAAEQMPQANEQQLQQLAPGILSSQYISEKSAADKIFGPAIPSDPQPQKKEFHFPHQPNMITMLDRSVNDLPFAYTPGLVDFAYDPGLKGDLQRFYDKITPEFGWKNNYGTQYKCKWILVIAACGWGRIKDHVKDHNNATADFMSPEQQETAN